MADSGWLSFGTASSEVYNGTAAWGTPSNALTENDTFTSAGPIAKFESTDYLRLTNISGLDIPEGATVTGFDVRVRGKTANDNPTMVPFVYLVLDGTRSPANQSCGQTLPGTTPSYVAFTDFGANPRNWEDFGLQYTPYTSEEMEGSGFGVDIVFSNGYFISDTPSIDNVQIKVYWDSPPAAPSSLAVGSATSTTINLTWTDNSDNEDNFELEKSLANADDWSTVDSSIAANATSYGVTGLSPETAYDFRLRAVNGVGNSDWVVLEDAETTPAAPAGSALQSKRLANVMIPPATPFRRGW